MNKKTIAEQILRILSGGDITIDSDFDIREIIMAVGQNADAAILDYSMKMDNSRQKRKFKVPNEFLKKDTVTLTANKGILSADASALTLPNRRTIYRMKFPDTTSNGCVTKGSEILPISVSRSLLEGLDSKNLEGNIGYDIDNYSSTSDGIEFELINTKTTHTSVEVYKIPSISKVSNTLTLPFPDYLISEVIARTVKEYAPHLEIQEDIKLDNVSN